MVKEGENVNQEMKLWLLFEVQEKTKQSYKKILQGCFFPPSPVGLTSPFPEVYRAVSDIC